MSIANTAAPIGSPPVSATRTISHPRLIAACTIGNALEFYDFVVFSFFARTIGALFFPAQDPAAQLLLSFATYGVGFFLRPLGGVVLGAYADRKGRKKATVLTLMLMAAGTSMVGLAPVYASAGVFGALVILAGRLLQGFSAGGEVGASTTLLAELAPKERRGFFGAWQLASQGLAVLVAASASVWAVGIELSLAKEAHAIMKVVHIGLAFVTVVASWLMVQMIFALHYAHEYYGVDESDGARDAMGIEFPGTLDPDYWDFLYFSIVIGVACATADANITSKGLRQLATVHCMVAFAFNTIIVALTINLTAGLF